MKRYGMNYDVGTMTSHNSLSRLSFDPAAVRREMEIIKRDLHCNAIRISGQDMARLAIASEYALQQGLEVWFSPIMIDATREQLLAYLVDCAQAAEQLRQQSPNVVFVVGCELTLFMHGLVAGATSYERMDTFMKPLRLAKSTIMNGTYHRRLNAFLSEAAAVVRQHFHGQMTYASGQWEKVDWSLFDVVAVDYYRDAANQRSYRRKLRAYFKHGKPVVVTEFGCCTYVGAGDKGGYGWAIVDWNTRRLTREFVRGEREQADYLIDLLDIFEAEGVDGAFVFTFLSEKYPHDENPDCDLDMASYSVVKTLASGTGTTYPDMAWEPKQSFDALADYYASHQKST
jgi:hypothetical protein